MSQWFAPTQLSITFEREGMGRFTEDEIANAVVKDDRGTVVALNLPTKHILVANHQVNKPPRTFCVFLPLIWTLDLRRLVVHMEFVIFHGHSQGHFHCPEEELEMGSHSRMGTT